MCRSFSPWERVGRAYVLRVGLGWGDGHQRFRETGSSSDLFSGDADVESISGLESNSHRVLRVCLHHKTLSDLQIPDGIDMETWHCLGQWR